MILRLRSEITLNIDIILVDCHTIFLDHKNTVSETIYSSFYFFQTIAILTPLHPLVSYDYEALNDE